MFIVIFTYKSSFKLNEYCQHSMLALILWYHQRLQTYDCICVGFDTVDTILCHYEIIYLHINQRPITKIDGCIVITIMYRTIISHVITSMKCNSCYYWIIIGYCHFYIRGSNNVNRQKMWLMSSLSRIWVPRLNFYRHNIMDVGGITNIIG